MKKIAMMIFGAVLALSLCACGCSNNTPATTPSVTNSSTTNTDKMPTDTMTIPVPETNIPDPSVDSSMPSTMPNGSTATEGNGNTGRARNFTNSIM